MAKLIYASNMSLDGCTEDERGAFDWAPPNDDVFAFITDLMRSAGTYLYGRRMYDTMAVWETDATLAGAVGPHERLRERLAGGGQNRLLHDPGRGVNRQHPARTPLRAQRSTRPEGGGQKGSHRGRS
jgi:hypothetical protein